MEPGAHVLLSWRPEDREAFVLALSSAALATDAVTILEKLRANDPAAESVLENVAVSLAAVVHKVATEFHILSSGARPGRRRRLPREVLFFAPSEHYVLSAMLFARNYTLHLLPPPLGRLQPGPTSPPLPLSAPSA